MGARSVWSTVWGPPFDISRWSKTSTWVASILFRKSAPSLRWPDVETVRGQASSSVPFEATRRRRYVKVLERDNNGTALARAESSCFRESGRLYTGRSGLRGGTHVRDRHVEYVRAWLAGWLPRPDHAQYREAWCPYKGWTLALGRSLRTEACVSETSYRVLWQSTNSLACFEWQGKCKRELMSPATVPELVKYLHDIIKVGCSSDEQKLCGTYSHQFAAALDE
ncbi:predicted protein [Pyrenophora tritici-repentis Pt-1C-BFP]|uniref:Uncharacterized protein n=1 Tax=Pyrenophora tritici-repentis (strain Pt-1C-BFP) TaxID=426418 RepID=B2WFV9_PYRTR|nr:uncharacterized protein PTRG_08815 [Pyrenophora tritici-repentis Pt-1C-BFP]EDU41866.1 predicted protein [Pyrenophora tritici-repentis Pt-1C-BFP]